MKRYTRIAGVALAIVATTTVAFAQDKVEVALGDVSLNKVAFLVAADNGIYEKYGLDVHQFITQGAADRISRSGINVPPEFVGTSSDSRNAHIAIGGGSPLIVQATMDADGQDRVIVATTDSTARFHIISSPELKSVEDLKGKRLGYSSIGSVSHLMALEFIRQMNWSQSEDISLMREGMDYSVLKSGGVDAFIGSEIYYTMAEKNGAKDLVDLTPYNIPLAGSGVNVRRDWFADNRDTTLRFVKATIESYALMKSDFTVVSNVLEKWYGITDTAQQREMYEQVATSPEKPYPAVDGIKLVMELFDHRELRRHQPSDFYDVSIVTEIDESGFIDEVYGH